MRRLISTGSPFERIAGYSRAVVQGDWCFVAGTTGYDYATMTMPQTLEAQARNCMATITRALAEGGFDLRDVVRVHYYVIDDAFVDEVFPIVGEYFADIRPAAVPATSQIARVQPGKAEQAPVLASASATPVAPAEESKPFLQRALSFMPSFGSAPATSGQNMAAAEAPVAVVVPAAPTSIRAPLPPRRATGLRTSRLDESPAAYASQPAMR